MGSCRCSWENRMPYVMIVLREARSLKQKRGTLLSDRV